MEKLHGKINDVMTSIPGRTGCQMTAGKLHGKVDDFATTQQKEELERLLVQAGLERIGG
jgi:hypothetical protein